MAKEVGEGAEPTAPKAAGPEITGPEVAGPALVGKEPVGPELARAVLEAAAAKRFGQRRTTGGAAGVGGRGAGRRARGYSGAGPDPRDPQTFSSLLAQLVKARGWQQPAAEARLFGAWPELVGEDIAQHCRPVQLADGELTIEAESTAWATQLRLLSRTLQDRLVAALGRGVVAKITVRGPVAPSWVKGPKRVKGRGPRDTYG